MPYLTTLITQCAARVLEPQVTDFQFKGVSGSVLRFTDQRQRPALSLTLTARQMMHLAQKALTSDAPIPSAYLTALRALDDQKKMGSAKPQADHHAACTSSDPTAHYAVGYTIPRPKR